MHAYRPVNIHITMQIVCASIIIYIIMSPVIFLLQILHPAPYFFDFVLSLENTIISNYTTLYNPE